MSVALFNLSRAEQRIADELDRRWARLREGTAFVGGAEVKEFEAAWAEFLDPEGDIGCVGVASGTDAIELPLRALGVGPGDEVLVPAYTFVGTASAVALAGATPVMVDVEPATLNLDFDRAGELVGERTVGVIGVHLYGHPCDLDRALEFTDKHGLWFIEDAAQAHGARWAPRPSSDGSDGRDGSDGSDGRSVGEGPCAPPGAGGDDGVPAPRTPARGDDERNVTARGDDERKGTARGSDEGWRRVGTFGDLATWSFYPSKNMGCFGDGGAVTGRDGELLERVRKLGDHGRIEHYWHGMVGRNSRLDALQAAVLNCRLPLLDDDNARRREVAARYREAIEELDGIEALAVDERAEPVFHQFTVRVKDRDAVKERLAEAGIGTAIHYPAPLHTQPLWRDREEVVRGSYPEAERAAREVLCLPMFPELTDEEVGEVVEALEKVFGA